MSVKQVTIIECDGVLCNIDGILPKRIMVPEGGQVQMAIDIARDKDGWRFTPICEDPDDDGIVTDIHCLCGGCKE
jgi:hypothetical protein